MSRINTVDNIEELSLNEIEERKKYMYEKMSKRRRKFVDRVGYENWDPFAAPFDPIDLRQDRSGYTSDQLTQLFIRETGNAQNQEFIDAVNEFNVMLVMNFEKVRPVFEYCLWYNEHLKKHGIKP
ncbi:hypothetical protein [Pseudodesulfovibrio sp. zrk46]|uniref:hypothetical protein n=1 Tax=Pseudodesulfovibrio sp. zrk46 TaxID=2725288 RepID=UPI001449FE98|nr:hypothetical protein [Pseudodesulfovibrio sp. zrk46]QJB58300.1 hypothetical protein HFN16_18780 [Pseudodesulfovibrio sp. zrk46]